MKEKIIYFLLFLSMSFYIFKDLSSQEQEDVTKKIEKKWGLEGDDDSFLIKKKTNNENIVPLFLTQFQPEKQEFSLNPTMENEIVGKMGTKITIPANSISLPMGYKRGDILRFELIEVYNDLDFITSGINLEYFNPNPHIFESGGMFKLTASYYDKPLNLKRGVKLKVEMPSLIYTSNKMNVYKLDEKKGWVDTGSMSSTQSQPNSEMRASFLFKFMDDFKWWNCDYPNPETTCLEGKVLGLENLSPSTVTLVGLDYKNAASRGIEKGRFQVNAIKGKRVKLIAMDEKGNIGLSAELDTGKLDAFLGTKAKEKCTDVGTIQIKKVDREILKDRAKLLNHLGLYDLK